MYLIDTHTHLYLNEFDSDRNETVNRALTAAPFPVKKMLLPNVDSTTIEGMMQLSESFPENCFPMIGLHPTSVKDNYKDELEIVENWLSRKKFFGIGEVGMDLYWDKTFTAEQIIVFKHQALLSRQYNLPLVIHSRNAVSELLQILESLDDKNLYGVFHCFGGNVIEAQRAVGHGFMIGVGGVITYKNSGLDRVISNIDINHIVLETDSPYLTPVPKRGQRNESAYINYVAQKVADTYKMEIEKVVEITTQNAERLFKF